ncbi:RNA polymerase sigma factor [Caldisericum exile]|uniref:RNA polymerase ECF-type sigma factor n=1 Tax=Caldisericum exile (strain DSM 21853 / NBRC 104410 / AZM16c01) TaxID=511051 RepID=A0A7U6GD52_CALEA|nr:sigma-70 family RNA polymerase sigma factor [Caldisericum exile]BAL80186.1 RNA polymerase ECF-type sigma factor [Caldisericum exile AZM16c01]
MDERELVKKALTDREAFGKIVDIYYKEVFGYIYKRTVDKELSKDLTQETFLKALKYIGSYKGRSPFIFWLLRIATNVINEHYKKEIKENKFISKYKGTHSENTSISPSDDIDYEVIYKYIKILPVVEQTVLTLVFFEHRSLKDVALILNYRESSVRKVYYRALSNLKKKIENDGYKF